jgi:hypothetical protein
MGLGTGRKHNKKERAKDQYRLRIDRVFDLGSLVKMLTNPKAKEKRQRFISTTNNFSET